MATYTPGTPRGFDSGVTAEEVEVWKASEAQRKKNAEIEGTATTPSAANDDQLPNPLKTTHEVDQYHDGSACATPRSTTRRRSRAARLP